MAHIPKREGRMEGGKERERGEREKNMTIKKSIIKVTV